MQVDRSCGRGIAARGLVAATMLGLGCADQERETRDGVEPSERASAITLQRPALRTESLPGRSGRWLRAQDTPRRGEDLDKAPEAIEALAYVSGSRPAPALRGVVRHDSLRTSPGLNFLTSGHAPEATLIDMAGRVLHTWHADFWDIWPDYSMRIDRPGTEYWRRAWLYDNGDILAIAADLGIVKLDRDSCPIWAKACRAHHDLEVLPNGDIYVLARETRFVDAFDARNPVFDDVLMLLGPDGSEKSRLSLLDCFQRSQLIVPPPGRRPPHNLDLFHTNSLRVLDGVLANKLPVFAAGNILLSILKLDTIAIVDTDRREVAWTLQADFASQHDARVLPDGRLMLIDNLGRVGQSSVEVYDPVSRHLEWEFRGTENEPFFTRTCGAARRLPNGNTLLVESDNGRALEIDAQGAVVWEYYNPHRAGPRNEYIAALFDLRRLPPEFPIHWAREAE